MNNNTKINITPLIDICISLLIVFMAGGKLFIEPSLKISLPEAKINEEKEETDKIIIYISKDEKYAVDDLELKFDDIEKILKKKLFVISSGLVVIKADKEVKFKILIRLMNLLKNLGINKITIATDILKNWGYYV